MTNRDWIDYFQTVYGRPPSPQEYAEALKRGEFVTASSAQKEENSLSEPKPFQSVSDQQVETSSSPSAQGLPVQPVQEVQTSSPPLVQSVQSIPADADWTTFFNHLPDKAKLLLIGIVVGLIIFFVCGFKDEGYTYFYGESWEVGSLFSPNIYSFKDYYRWTADSSDRAILKELNSYLWKLRFNNLPGVLVGAGVSIGCLYALGQDETYKRLMARRLFVKFGRED